MNGVLVETGQAYLELRFLESRVFRACHFCLPCQSDGVVGAIWLVAASQPTLLLITSRRRLRAGVYRAAVYVAAQKVNEVFTLGLEEQQ